MYRAYKTIGEIKGPLVTLERVYGEKPGDQVEILQEDGEISLGRILETHEDRALILLYDETKGLNPETAKARLWGRPMEFSASEDMLGRAFDGLGRPRDGGPELIPEMRLNINGAVNSEAARLPPEGFIQTGISAIDGLCPLMRGQILSLFSGTGLPHSRLAAQIARSVKSNDNFAVVFCAMGLSFEDAEFFEADFRRSGMMNHTVMFTNLAGDPAMQRIATPRIAMTAAEYLAFFLDMHVLVIMTDVKNYINAAREVSRGFSGHLHSDLSSIFERSGRRRGKTGSITLIPITTAPERDLLGQISEGQIVLSETLHQKGIYPPIDPCYSASRLMNRCITREDHALAATQIISAYACANEGDSAFTEAFEREYIAQNSESVRTLEETLNLHWKLLSMLPRQALKRIDDTLIEKYLP